MTVRAQPRWSAEVQTGSPLDLTPWLIDVNLQIGARFGASVTRVTPGAKGKMNLHNPDNLWVPARSTRFSESELARPIPVRCDMVFPNGDTERWWNGFLILGAAHRNIAEESIAADLTDQLTQNATRKIAVTQTGGTVEAVAKKVSAASGLPIQWETLGLEKATISGVTKTQPLGGWVRDLQTAFPAWAWMVPAGDEVDEFMAAKRYVYTGTTIGIDPPTGSRPEITNAAINGGSPRFLDEIRIDPTRSRIELNIASTQTANDRADLSSQWEGRGEFKLEALGQEVSVTNAGLDPSDPYRWTLASVDAQGLARFVRALNDRGNQQTDVTVTFGLPGAGTSKLVIGGMAERRGREQSACLNFRDLHMTGVDEGPDHTRVVNRIVVEDAAKTAVVTEDTTSQGVWGIREGEALGGWWNRGATPNWSLALQAAKDPPRIARLTLPLQQPDLDALTCVVEAKPGDVAYVESTIGTIRSVLQQMTLRQKTATLPMITVIAQQSPQVSVFVVGSSKVGGTDVVAPS